MGIIYCIECLETGEKYIGSTRQTLKHRVSQHRYEAKNIKKCSSKQILDRGNYTFYSLEDVEDEGKLLEREQHHIDTTECINQVNPFGFDKKAYLKEYREENSEKLKVSRAIYHEKNRDKINAKKKKKIVCECGAVIRHGDIARHRKTQRHLSVVNHQEPVL